MFIVEDRGRSDLKLVIDDDARHRALSISSVVGRRLSEMAQAQSVSTLSSSIDARSLVTTGRIEQQMIDELEEARHSPQFWTSHRQLRATHALINAFQWTRPAECSLCVSTSSGITHLGESQSSCDRLDASDLRIPVTAAPDRQRLYERSGLAAGPSLGSSPTSSSD